MLRFLFVFSCFVFPLFVSAQNTDSTVIVSDSLIEMPIATDTLKQGKPVWMTPKKVALFSAILPGLGQAYNRQSWKIPIVYVGLGIAGYFIADNLKTYNAFRQVYAGRISGDNSVNLKYPAYADYSDDVIKNARDESRQNLDITVLLTALGYGLQIADALVFAQLKNFDISPDITFYTKPVVYPYGGFGIGIVMNF